ncbi:MAG: hypothetical protein KC656_01365 [Myxococcales bacterium]|nr:hypothetical protein [Myxococcales bacterium]
MNKSIAKYGIPAQALAVLTTLGCEGTDPMVGDWTCTFFAYNGSTSECPSTVTSNEGGYTYEAYYAIQMSVREDGGGTFTDIVELKVDGVVDDDYSYTTDYPLTGTAKSTGVWDISVPGFYGLIMECTATASDMTCYGTDSDDYAWEFNFAPLGGGDVIL